MDGLMMDFPLTLDVILRRAETIFGDREVVTRQPDKTWHRYSYADAARRAKALALALQKLGVGTGDRVATLCWNHYRHLEAYLGIPSSGAVLHTLNLRLHPDELAFIVNEADDKVLIVDESLLPIWEPVSKQTNVSHVIVIPDGDTAPGGMLEYESLLAECDASNYQQPRLNENQAASMCYTSGTVGKSKGVVYSHRALTLHTIGAALTSGFEVYERDCVLPVVPMFHVNAWGIPYIAPMMGAKTVYPGPHMDAKSLAEAFAQEKVTLTAGVPTVWIGLLKELDANPDKYDLSTLRTVMVGGSALPRSLMEGFESRHGIRLVHAWGMTETTPIGTVSWLRHDQYEATAEKQITQRGRQGTPMPLVEIRASREEGEVPWDGKTMGELEVRGPWVAREYFNRPDAADRFTDDGWLRTGDIVSIDARGTMKIEDRAKDLIKSGGEWISSVDLENAIMAHPAVEEAAVIAVFHEKWSERPVAAVVVKDDQSVTADELQAHLAPNFPKWWLPDAFEFVEAIPRTSTGKFKKAALREQLGRN